MILSKPINILMIAVPLVVQTILIFFIAYLGSKKLKLPHNIAGPASLIGSSNFFELAVAVAISLFGAGAPVTLVAIVGVFVEVPLMIMLVKVVNKTKGWFQTTSTIGGICDEYKTESSICLRS